MKSKLFLLLILLSPWLTYSQKVTTPLDINEHINKLLLTKGEEADNQSYYELLMQFYNSPININQVNFLELSALQILTDKQIQDIIAYRTSFGSFTTKYELLAIESLELEDIKNILPFLSFSKPINFKNLIKDSFSPQNNYVLTSGSYVLESAEGFVSDKFIGDPYQYNLRFKMVNRGHSSLGITLQKDPGELLFRNDSLHNGPDFYSFHYYIQNQGPIKQFVLGDYKLQFGQGLLLGAGFLVGKNASSITSIQTTLKIQPYTSLTEYRFFRGSGATISLSPNWEISVFYSSRTKDASITAIDGTENNFTSLRTQGLHRTNSELLGQNTIREQVAGTSLIYTNKGVEVGMLGLYNQFNTPFIPKNTLENIYKFTGQENYNLSVFGRYNYQNITVYGEAAHTINNGSAINAGIIAGMSKAIDFSFQYRYLDPNFHSFYGVGFSENSVLANERGAYWGLQIKLIPDLSLMGYFDMYKFPWLKTSIPQPTTGNDGLLRLAYKLKKSTLIYTQVQSEQKSRKIANSVVKESKSHRLVKFILNLDYALDKPLSFRSRVQWTKSYFTQNEVGLLIYQDVNVNLNRVTLSGRYAIFDTDGFLSRQYMYEKGILYSFNTPQFSGNGVRYYLVTKYTLLKGLVFRAKWSQTIYYDRSYIGSGISEIEGNKKSQITFQVKYDF